MSRSRSSLNVIFIISKFAKGLRWFSKNLTMGFIFFSEKYQRWDVFLFVEGKGDQPAPHSF
jgi:hypothetical protein